MKKYLLYLMVLVTILIPCVKADVDYVVGHRYINSKDIEANTYVIGNYMFTRSSNNTYNGQLTTKLIMLASKTIQGDTLDDMIIYYKTSRGRWIDGLSGDAITPPEEFDIENQDTISIPIQPALIIPSQGGTYENDVMINGFTLAIDYSSRAEVFCNINEEGYSFYGDYNFNLDYYDEGVYIPEEELLIWSPETSTTFCKIRTYVESGTEKIYSEFSSEFGYGNFGSSDSLIVSSYGSVYNPETNKEEFGVTFQLRDQRGDNDTLVWIPEDGGVMLYASRRYNGEFKLVETIPYEDIYIDEQNGYEFGHDVEDGYVYYKARVYRIVDGKTIYGDYTNIIRFDDVKKTPYISLDPGYNGGSVRINVYDSDGMTDLNIPENQYLTVYFESEDSHGYQDLDHYSSTYWYGNEITSEKLTIGPRGNYFIHDIVIPPGKPVKYKVRICSDYSVCGSFSNEITIMN